MSSTVILLNEQNPQGIFVDPSVPLISVDDQGFTRGDGVLPARRPPVPRLRWAKSTS